MKTFYPAILLLLIFFTSCSSRQFAFRKTYHVAPGEKVVMHKQKSVDPCRDTAIVEAPVLSMFTADQTKKVPSAAASQLIQPATNISDHPEKQPGIGADPIPLPVPHEEQPRSTGTVALIFIIAAYLMVGLVGVGLEIAFAFAFIFWLIGLVLSIIALRKKHHKNSALLALLFAIVLLFVMFLVSAALTSNAAGG